MPIMVLLYRCLTHRRVVVPDRLLEISELNFPDLVGIPDFHDFVWWYFSHRLHRGLLANWVQVSTRVAIGPLHDLLEITGSQWAVNLFHNSLNKTWACLRIWEPDVNTFCESTKCCLIQVERAVGRSYDQDAGVRGAHTIQLDQKFGLQPSRSLILLAWPFCQDGIDLIYEYNARWLNSSQSEECPHKFLAFSHVLRD